MTSAPQTHRIVTALLLILAMAATGSSAAESDPAGNVLILTIDTLRADRMSGYGYERPTSPNLDRLMQTGARFTQTRTVEPSSPRPSR